RPPLPFAGNELADPPPCGAESGFNTGGGNPAPWVEDQPGRSGPAEDAVPGGGKAQPSLPGSETDSSSTSRPSSRSTFTLTASGSTFTYWRITSSSSRLSRGR